MCLMWAPKFGLLNSFMNIKHINRILNIGNSGADLIPSACVCNDGWYGFLSLAGKLL